MQQKTGKISLKDIAREVGVSAALVSYVLNNRFENRISKEVADKIRKTAKKLQYQPNQIAKSLKTRRTFTIGLVVADIANPFSSSLARIIEDEGAKYGYTVIFGSSDEDINRFEKLIHTFLNRQVDGLILLPPEGAEEQITRLKNIHFPFVIVDRYFPKIDAHYVNVNNVKAAYDAVKLLIDNGKKRIGLINYKTELYHLNDRTKGYTRALKEAKITPDKSLVKKVGIDNDPAEIIRAVASLLSAPAADAILFASNRIAVHALMYLQQQSIAIPASLQVIAFDEQEVFDFYQPQVTFVKQPMLQLGQIATDLLIDSITKNKMEQQVFIPAEIVKRGSTGH
ncbi:LacI family DNA-binding transcriptional regulator [Niabella aquatica]